MELVQETNCRAMLDELSTLSDYIRAMRTHYKPQMNGERYNAYSQRFWNKYNYDNQFREHTYKKETIKLPVDLQGNPDWEFMDNYIKSLPYSANL